MIRGSDMLRFAVLFPGQGIQYVGMGKTLAATYPTAAEIFQTADQILAFPLSELCFSGPESELSDTANSQPAIYVTTLAVWQILKEHLGGKFTPDAFVGHSLGEYSALTASGALDFADGLRLVRARGLAMREAGNIVPGGMLAVLGVALEVAQAMCQEIQKSTGMVIEVANDNCPGQAVVAGEQKALDIFLRECERRGFMSPHQLNVSVAPHTSLMEAALPQFLQVLSSTPICAPSVPVLGNVSADWLNTAETVREDLRQQLTHAVRWTTSMQRLVNTGIDVVIEIGPGNVLTGLMRRIDRSVKRINLGDNLDKLDDVLALLFNKSPDELDPAHV
jgi:[acyl-carrier-protein] S-malonyltransferase